MKTLTELSVFEVQPWQTDLPPAHCAAQTSSGAQPFTTTGAASAATARAFPTATATTAPGTAFSSASASARASASSDVPRHRKGIESGCTTEGLSAARGNGNVLTEIGTDLDSSCPVKVPPRADECHCVGKAEVGRSRSRSRPDEDCRSRDDSDRLQPGMAVRMERDGNEGERVPDPPGHDEHVGGKRAGIPAVAAAAAGRAIAGAGIPTTASSAQGSAAEAGWHDERSEDERLAKRKRQNAELGLEATLPQSSPARGDTDAVQYLVIRARAPSFLYRQVSGKLSCPETRALP